MIDGGEEERKRKQGRALDVYSPTGALLVPKYLVRQQEVIGVNRDDLDDILSFDRMATFFGGFGLFLLSGSVWLLVDKITSQPDFTMTMTIGICAVAALSGLVFLAAGIYLQHQKRGRINRIYNQTQTIS